MKIAVEATATCNPVRTGVARYAVRFVDALLEVAAETPGEDVSLGFRLSRWRKRRGCHVPRGVRAFWIQEPWWPPRPGVEVVHGTDARVPDWRGVGRVATIHDMGVHLFPEFASRRFRERQLRESARLAATAHVIVADSETTRRDFLRFHDFPPEDLVTVPLGVEPAFGPVSEGDEEVRRVRRAHGLERPYLLYLGRVPRRKNCHTLIEAFAASGLAGDFDLVLGGGANPGPEPFRALSEHSGVARETRLLGFVADGDLPALYAGAAAFCFPTIYEGFGLPVLEAMASGVPVVGGSLGAVPEVAGGHAVPADPRDAAAIGAAMHTALALPQAARDAARAHAATFTWERCARETRATYQRAIEKARG